MQLTDSWLNGLYRGVLGAVLDQGDLVAPRGLRTKELLGWTITLRDPLRNLLTIPSRRLSQTYAVAEWLWILLGREDVATIGRFNRNIAGFSDDGRTFFGAYGPRLAAQLPGVVDLLRRDPDTRQAVVSLWRPSPPATRDVPCTLSFQYLLRDGKLQAHTYMRSNDAWLGLPYDVFTFTRLQAYVAGLLGVPLGPYRHTVGSLHLYERDWGAASVVAEDRTGPMLWSPPLTPMPADLGAAFATVADPARAAGLYPGWETGCDEPWATYLGLLLYKTLKDRALLRAPYDEIIAPPAVPA